MSLNDSNECRIAVQLQVNGTSFAGEVAVRVSLADFLRGELGLKGTHVGCEQGVCGACTVLLDGRPVRSCITLAIQADDCNVETVEGLAEGHELSYLQAAFKAQHGLQCGFCTPGFLMLLAGTASSISDRQSARETLSANLCRCTGYRSIVDSALSYTRGKEDAE